MTGPSLWLALLSPGVLAGPTATWAAVSVTGSLGMLGVPLLAIAGIAIVILDRNN